MTPFSTGVLYLSNAASSEPMPHTFLDRLTDNLFDAILRFREGFRKSLVNIHEHKQGDRLTRKGAFQKLDRLSAVVGVCFITKLCHLFEFLKQRKRLTGALAGGQFQLSGALEVNLYANFSGFY